MSVAFRGNSHVQKHLVGSVRCSVFAHCCPRSGRTAARATLAASTMTTPAADTIQSPTPSTSSIFTVDSGRTIAKPHFTSAAKTPSLDTKASRTNLSTNAGPRSTQALSASVPDVRGGSMAYNKFLLYETKHRFYIVASNTSESRHRITKIDRTSQDELVIVEDESLYTGKQMGDMLKMLEDGNRAQGGLGKARAFFGIAGALRSPYFNDTRC